MNRKRVLDSLANFINIYLLLFCPFFLLLTLLDDLNKAKKHERADFVHNMLDFGAIQIMRAKKVPKKCHVLFEWPLPFVEDKYNYMY